VVAALTAPQFGILVPLVAGIQSLLPDAEDRGLPEPTSVQQIAVIVVALLAGAFLLSVLGAVVAFGGFELERDGDRLRVRRGILQRRTASVPLSRVDGVRIVEGLLRERLGLASLRLETAGLRGEDAAARTLFPLVRRRDIPDLLARFVPDLAGGIEALEPPPPRSRRRYVATPALLGAAAGAALAVALPALWPAVLGGLALGAALGEARFRAAGVQLEAGRVVLRERRLARTTVLARRHRLQAQHLRVSPLQRRGDVATLGRRPRLGDVRGGPPPRRAARARGVRGAAAGTLMAAPSPPFTRRPRLAPVDHGPSDRRRVALTFDDGPGRLTEALLDVLGGHGARATFFVLGERVAGREDLVRRAVAEGHEVGSHAWGHEPLAGRPAVALRDLVRGRRAIARACGRAPRVFRAPYGAVSPGVVAAARAAGMATIGWDVDPRDYETPGADAIAERVLAGASPGSVVLLHDDRRALAPTVTAVARVVPVLRGRGLALVTVSELLRGA
jgi:peptidoglycan/xylan/chitin deacetylase (PgdA/CDA1 family)